MSDDSRPVPVTKLRGKVTKAHYGAGSKSERDAIFLETDDGRYLLRRKAGPAYADATLEEHVGHSVECDGFLVGSTLLAEVIRQLK